MNLRVSELWGGDLARARAMHACTCVYPGHMLVVPAVGNELLAYKNNHLSKAVIFGNNPILTNAQPEIIKPLTRGPVVGLSCYPLCANQHFSQFHLRF